MMLPKTLARSTVSCAPFGRWPRSTDDLAKIFVVAGVRFERPITNHETLWTM